MENKARIGTQKIVKWILNIVIIVVSVIFLLTAAAMAEELFAAFGKPYTLKNADYHITQERYYQLVDAYHYNTAAGFEGSGKETEYYGVAQYYEAATLYKAYTEAGNAEWAQFFLEKMQQAESEMGSWSITKTAIHTQLGIE